MSDLKTIISLLKDPAPNAERLLALAARLNERFDPTGSEVSALWNLSRHRDLRNLPLEPLSVALLSNTTQDFFVPYLFTAGIAAGLHLDVFWEGAGRIADLVLAPNTSLHKARPGVIFISYNQEEALGSVFRTTFSRRERVAAADHLIEEMRAVVERLVTDLPAARIVLHSFYSYEVPALGLLDATRSDGPSDVTAHLNAGLVEIARSLPSVNILDMQSLVGALGYLRWRDNNRWFGESVETVSGNGALAAAYLRAIKSFTKRSRKVIVLDLDNTLWGGLAGEDGLTGVRLGGGYPGNVFQQFQQALNLYSQRGILLAINSKNNREDAIAILEQHPDMVLRPDNFVAMEINWDDKATNMLRIANTLDLGLNSFVFIDDSPQEREHVRLAVPEVLVPEFPRKLADLPYLLGQINDLDSDTFTETDRQRSHLYRMDGLRRSLRQSAATMDDYLSALQTSLVVSRAKGSDIARVEQMFQRTNQFNVTTKRYSARELESFAKSDDCLLLQGDVSDRFGNHGTVVVAVIRFDQRAVIDSFLMSCRVIGRGVESAMLACVANFARLRGYTELWGEFVATKRNAPSRDFYVKHGFTALPSTNGSELFRLGSLSDGPPTVPHHVKMSVIEHD